MIKSINKKDIRFSSIIFYTCKANSNFYRLIKAFINLKNGETVAAYSPLSIDNDYPHNEIANILKNSNDISNYREIYDILNPIPLSFKSKTLIECAALENDLRNSCLDLASIKFID